MKKISSLTIFFPFYNDEGTVAKAINDAYRIGKNISSDLEVIAIIGGRSTDKTKKAIHQQKKLHKDLIIIDKTENHESYAVIKYGFKKATKDWIFYTDGDLQYDLEELPKLIHKQQNTKADVINGYKVKRNDSIFRVVSGNLYRYLSRVAFDLPIRDLDCDFRLINSRLIKKINLKATDSSILLEMIKKLQGAKAKFSEIPVNHRKRIYGKSTYGFFTLIKEKIIGDLKVSAAGFGPIK